MLEFTSLHRLCPKTAIPLLLALSAALAGCGGDAFGDAGEPCSVEAQTGCGAGLACEEVEGGAPACFTPLVVTGRVTGALDDAPIAGARVIARDASGEAASTVAVTAADGTYTLRVPAKRDAGGAPISTPYTLRVDAAGYLTFPSAPRAALPIDVAIASGEAPVVASAATEIALIPLADASGMGTIAGRLNAARPGGTLLVAGGATAIADRDGAFEIFNVPEGMTEVRAYQRGLLFEHEDVSVTAGTRLEGVALSALGPALASVAGKVEIVNGGSAASTSVVLALAGTFDAALARGEVPIGLRAENVAGEFVIDGVPDGDYVVLTAFDNDGLVRDPDVAIGGADLVGLSVAGEAIAFGTSFKVTGALPVVGPGTDTIGEVRGTPTFVWGDDFGEDHYEIQLHDARGELVWKDDAVPGASGGKHVSVTYRGPALTPGMIYRFTATSIKDGGSRIATTEDLRGVFVYR